MFMRETVMTIMGSLSNDFEAPKIDLFSFFSFEKLFNFHSIT